MCGVLNAYAGGVRRIMTGAGDMFVVVASAATVDAEVAQLASTTEARRRIGAASVVVPVEANLATRLSCLVRRGAS